MIRTTTLRRLASRRSVAAAAVALGLVVGATASGAASPPVGSANSAPAAAGAAPPADVVLSAGEASGTELRFISLAPCRMFDTRAAGGKIANTVRNFVTTGSLAAQGGSAGGCGVPAYAKAVQLNLGAISRDGTSGYVSAWAAGSPEPLASLVNFDPSGPKANMVTAALGIGGQISLRANPSADVFADIAGYWTKPLYAFLDSAGNVFGGYASGVVSTSRTDVGRYNVTFERNVRGCASVGSSQHWLGVQEVSVSTIDSSDPNTVIYDIRDQNGTAVDDWAYISLTC